MSPPVVFGTRVRSGDLGHLDHADKDLEPIAPDFPSEAPTDLGPNGGPEEVVDGIVIEERAHET